jgi:methyl coenzyme M reductase subunit C-like uncharacterized protein (methanogenesis marker protein 7)
MNWDMARTVVEALALIVTGFKIARGVGRMESSLRTIEKTLTDPEDGVVHRLGNVEKVQHEHGREIVRLNTHLNLSPMS